MQQTLFIRKHFHKTYQTNTVNHIKQAGATALGKALKVNATLSRLNLCSWGTVLSKMIFFQGVIQKSVVNR